MRGAKGLVYSRNVLPTHITFNLLLVASLIALSLSLSLSLPHLVQSAEVCIVGARGWQNVKEVVGDLRAGEVMKGAIKGDI